MQKRIKSKFVKALRSGDYEQGRGVLCDVSGEVHKFCPVGVLINEITGFDGIKIMPRYGGRVERVAYVTPKGNRFAGCPFNAWMHLGQYCDEYGLTLEQENILIRMNDTKRKSFEEIADWVEENL